MPAGKQGSGGSRRGGAGRAKTTPKRAGSSSTRQRESRADNTPISRLARVAWTEGSRVLAALPPQELEAIQAALETQNIEAGTILYEQDSRIDFVYFPDTAVCSLLSRMSAGSVVEVGTIGNEGMTGLPVFLGTTLSPTETLVQIPGTMRRMPVAEFTKALAELPTLHALVGRCTHAFMTQVSQTAACNRLHGIEQRCARWLLLTHDRVGAADSFPLTHKFLSFMLGVRRAGVTEALGVLTNDGLITSGRGHITILDRRALEDASCECYELVRRHSAEPFSPTISPASGRV